MPQAPHPNLRVERRTIADGAFDVLRQRILTGDLKQGEALRQDVLAEALGVSRIPVREALRRLQSEGLVVNYPHRGAVVASLSTEEIAELFDLRALLEPELLRLSIPRMQPQDLAAARRILIEYERELDTADVHSWGELNTRYHLALYTPSGRGRTLEIVRALLGNTDRYTRVLLSLTERVSQAKQDHAELLQLCAAGKVEAAVALTRDHVVDARDTLIAFLGRESGRASVR